MSFWAILWCTVAALGVVAILGLTVWWVEFRRKSKLWVLLAALLAFMYAVPFVLLACPVLEGPTWSKVLVEKCHWEVKE